MTRVRAPRFTFAALLLASGAVPLLAQPASPPSTAQPQDPAREQLAYTAPFFPGAAYDTNVPEPSAILGFPVGSRAASHAQIEAVIKAIAAKSPRCRVVEYGKTHEGRTLYYVAVSSEENIARLDQIKKDAAQLADPRTCTSAEGDAIAARMPAIAWMAYVIHGDEMSGSDASLAALYHLAACTDAAAKELLNSVVVLIDPLMNPDGRDRCITGINQHRTAQPDVDDQSILHSQTWPGGRMNHYLFDMNRDWIFGTQPESRGRIAAAGAWHPHYFIESHEQGSQDTFLFMPPREPKNPNLPENVRKWQDRFGDDQGRAFDAKTWRYYTGEWNEEWYPGYSGSWAELRNAVGNLYEQANIATDGVLHATGVVEPYRLAVHKQLVSTMANLTYLGANRAEILRDYLAARRENVRADGRYGKRAFAIVPGGNSFRTQRLLDLLTLQGFEAVKLEKPWKAGGRDRLGVAFSEREFPAGTIIIAANQPDAPLLNAMFEFDPRMKPEFLSEERKELLRFGRSRLYDITAWNIPMLFDLDAYEVAAAPPPNVTRIGEQSPAPMPAPLTAPPPSAPQAAAERAVALVIDGADDRSVAAAGRLMERGVRLRVTDKPTQLDGIAVARGSVLALPVDNPRFGDRLAPAVDAVAAELGVAVRRIGSGMGPGDMPDLGGGHFVLLDRPRIAVVGQEPFDPYGYGEAWYFIDHELGVRASYLNAAQVKGVDLRRYNVIVLPDCGDRDFITSLVEPLTAWVKEGGTLIAIGGSAAALATEKGGIGSVRLLPDVLGKLDAYRLAVVREWEGVTGNVDANAVWSSTPPKALAYPWTMDADDDKPDADELKRRDQWRSLFSPQGAVLAGRVDDRSWLTAGCGDVLPALVAGGNVLMAGGDAQAPVRLGVYRPAPPEPAKPEGKKDDAAKDQKAADDKSNKDEKDKSDKTKDEKPKPAPKPGWWLAPPGHELRLRMSGLLWPEAADRLAHGAYVTRESIGTGQVIMFTSSPTFRAATLGTARVFNNAVIYGPGMGTTPPIRQ